MNRNQLTAIISLTVLVIFAYYYYQITVKENVPGENQYRLANKHLEDGTYDEALQEFDKVLTDYPDYKEAYMGKALTLMQMNELDKSMEAFNRAIALDDSFALAYANRGILNDRMGRYPEAAKDYRKAIELDPKLNEGPGWLWRFLHNVADRPPTISDRADYIESELKKPESERLLRVPDIDKQQRMYKK